jgi:superfamily II DNA or RNA helicase
MPRVFDNMQEFLLLALQKTLEDSLRADFCVGYFNLRGWKSLEGLVERWDGTVDSRCRLLIGMQKAPQDELMAAYSLSANGTDIDNQLATRLRQRMADEFRRQLAIGAPTNADESALRRLSAQLKSGKVVVKLFLEHTLHAKLYLLYRHDFNNPITGFLGSSNLTYSGLSGQGELNVDVLEQDACLKLERWFQDCWDNRWCIDISQELAQIIDESWAREIPLSPYYVYLKMAYHLSQEARAGLSEFQVPKEFQNVLFDFQTAAVKIAAHHLNKRGGVLIGDVVGLGKTLVATALARVFQDDFGTDTLIICPKNLVKMWEDHAHRYRLLAKVMSLSVVQRELPDLRRYRIVLIDESHNLRNREGHRYRAIQQYVRANESRCILLSATPYNKTYEDLSNQLRLFILEGTDLGVRPEKRIKDIGETEFIRRHQCPVRSLEAFEKSDYADDWRELMRLFLVRRTRSFIQNNYAKTDPEKGRDYLEFPDGRKFYFPDRIPKTLKFAIDDTDPNDPYARLYSDSVVDAINALKLPRYGMATYLDPHGPEPTAKEKQAIADLSRGGRRLMGFCRTNLFKRLESGGPAFIQSIERHILRNFVLLHAAQNGLDIPLGTQDAEYLDVATSDEDVDPILTEQSEDGGLPGPADEIAALRSEGEYRQLAQVVYSDYAGRNRRRFKWLRAALFAPSLASDLLADSQSLLNVREACGQWDAGKDAKLAALFELVCGRHPQDKVLVFSQYADTVHYLKRELRSLGATQLEGITGDVSDPTGVAWRFSPISNEKRDSVSSEQELRVLVATDVLSEGQNLQDCAIVVNYDLPWAIIRLIQRAGRVDRIGQQSDEILCYSFLPAEGVERIIKLRSRVAQRLRENDEVVGGDESFFEGELGGQALRDLYTEKASLLEQDADGDVDLASYAYQIWKNAADRQPALKGIIPALPDVVYATRAWHGTEERPEGVLVYMRTAEGNDALAWIDQDGKAITESQLIILQAAACEPVTPGMERRDPHHDLVQHGVRHLIAEERTIGGQLGRPSGARFRTYERLKNYAARVKDTLFDTPQLHEAVDEIYRYPLQSNATNTLNRQLKSGIDDSSLADLVTNLRHDDQLCQISEEHEQGEPQIICSLGLFDGSGEA